MLFSQSHYYTEVERLGKNEHSVYWTTTNIQMVCHHSPSLPESPKMSKTLWLTSWMASLNMRGSHLLWKLRHFLPFLPALAGWVIGASSAHGLFLMTDCWNLHQHYCFQLPPTYYLPSKTLKISGNISSLEGGSIV